MSGKRTEPAGSPETSDGEVRCEGALLGLEAEVRQVRVEVVGERYECFAQVFDPCPQHTRSPKRGERAQLGERQTRWTMSRGDTTTGSTEIEVTSPAPVQPRNLRVTCWLSMEPSARRSATPSVVRRLRPAPRGSPAAPSPRRTAGSGRSRLLDQPARKVKDGGHRYPADVRTVAVTAHLSRLDSFAEPHAYEDSPDRLALLFGGPRDAGRREAHIGVELLGRRGRERAAASRAYRAGSLQNGLVDPGNTALASCV